MHLPHPVPRASGSCGRACPRASKSPSTVFPPPADNGRRRCLATAVPSRRTPPRHDDLRAPQRASHRLPPIALAGPALSCKVLSAFHKRRRRRHPLRRPACRRSPARVRTFRRVSGNTSAARFDRCASYPARVVSFSGGVSSSTTTSRSISLSRVASPRAREPNRITRCGLKYSTTGSSSARGTAGFLCRKLTPNGPGSAVLCLLERHVRRTILRGEGPRRSPDGGAAAGSWEGSAWIWRNIPSARKALSNRRKIWRCAAAISA